MALNLQTLRTRSLTAVVFVLVMLAGLLWSYWAFFILFSVIHFGCWTEYQKIVARIDRSYGEISNFHKYAVMIGGWCLLLYSTKHSFTILGVSAAALGWWLALVLIFALPLAELLFSRGATLKQAAYSVLGLIYVSLSWALMMSLRSHPLSHRIALTDNARVIPCAVVFSIWINDTMAYIVGSLIGKTPFSKISPKKTWEGTAGGAVLCIALISYAGWRLHWLRVHDWIAISAIAAVFGTAGDLLESKLKRLAGLKDSGQIMPGHGGFLDRFDSLLVATPVVWLYVKCWL